MHFQSIISALKYSVLFFIVFTIVSMCLPSVCEAVCRWLMSVVFVLGLQRGSSVFSKVALFWKGYIRKLKSIYSNLNRQTWGLWWSVVPQEVVKWTSAPKSASSVQTRFSWLLKAPLSQAENCCQSSSSSVCIRLSFMLILFVVANECPNFWYSVANQNKGWRIGLMHLMVHSCWEGTLQCFVLVMSCMVYSIAVAV